MVIPPAVYFVNAFNLPPRGSLLTDHAYNCRCMKARVGGSLCVFLVVLSPGDLEMEIDLWSSENLSVKARAGSPTVTRRFPT